MFVSVSLKNRMLKILLNKIMRQCPVRVAREVESPLVIRCGIPDKFEFLIFHICQVEGAVTKAIL